MNKDVTIIIPSYRSNNLILSHLKNLTNYKVVIIENSYDNLLKKIIKKNIQMLIYI